MMIVMLGIAGCSAQKTGSTVEPVKKEKVIEEEEKVDAPVFELVDFIQGEYQEALDEVNEITKEKIEGAALAEDELKERMSGWVTRSFYDQNMKDSFAMEIEGGDGMLLPHNLFPEVRQEIIKDEDFKKVFTILMFSNESTTGGGYVDFTVVWEEDKWKVDQMETRPPDFDLTAAEVQKLYGDHKVTILEEKDAKWGEEAVKVFTYKVEEDGEEKFFDIYRNNGQRFEVSGPELAEAEEEEEPAQEKAAEPVAAEGPTGFAGNWEREGAQETYYGKIAITGSADGGYQYVGEALYGQSTADMTGGFVSEGSQAVFVDPNLEGCQVTFTKTSESSMEVVEGNECGYGGLNANFTGTYHLQE
ncbi:hypothetical protein [Rossellomorea marisflavi]|uniref:hypothetical protein n=1 Tax=Rossellomorea marisflavi TaxID=189381 RepID=UPI001EE31F14|nr:hypothetical protein [Rossellomorea marisflavi]UKS64967.1 hypothetical protein K6T23_19895 [Rossellomorea marisflavi]